MSEVYTITIQDAVIRTGLSKSWLVKLCQRGEVGSQHKKHCTWLLSEKDVAYLLKRKGEVRPGRPGIR